VRRLNEDAFLAVDGMFVVADGMGGHAAGDVASALTVEVCREFAEVVPVRVTELEHLVSTANSRVRTHAVTSGSEGMGTTLVGVVLVDNGGTEGLVAVNVGDSRCYSWDDLLGLVQVTHDHSAVQELLDAGTITPDEAARHPERNVVTRAVGIEPAVAADFVVLPRVDRQRLMLCSDGVSGPVPAGRIDEILSTSPDAVTAVTRLIDEVMTGEARDNATVVVVDVGWDVTTPEADDDSDDITTPRPRPDASPPTSPDEPAPAPVVPPLIDPPLIDRVPIDRLPAPVTAPIPVAMTAPIPAAVTDPIPVPVTVPITAPIPVPVTAPIPASVAAPIPAPITARLTATAPASMATPITGSMEATS
jgi:protein phosphatase